MKTKELGVFRKKEINDLKKIAAEKMSEAREAYTFIRVGKEKNVRKNKILRREIAQILTIVREKEIISGDSKFLSKEREASIISKGNSKAKKEESETKKKESK